MLYHEEADFPREMRIHPERVVPHGPYCRDSESRRDCPFWDREDTEARQGDGYCWLTHESDADNKFGLLWDMIKSCDINN